jgi:serine/threonine-protein kinase
MFKEGQQIGLYTLIRKLGRGGFGEVWLAERKSKFVTTKVAVKLPHDEQVDHDAIKQEAQLWEQASGHPNVLPIIDADEYDGQIVIVSEYAPDGSLADKLKTDGKLSATQAVEMTTGVLSGLSFLHSKGIIHRDIKPQNVLLQGDTPRLADFGISRLMQATAVSSAIIGTDAYMAPESFEGKRNVQTDIWSVGVVLYQLLQGNLPFTQEHPSERMFAILTKNFAPLPDDIPQSLKNVVAKALAKQPQERYQQAHEMREDLRRILRGEAVADFTQSDLRQTFPAEQVTQIRKSAQSSTQDSQDENETVVRSAPSFRQSEKRKNSNVWMYATLAIVLIGAIGFGVYFLTNQSKQNDSNKSEVSQLTETQPNNNSANPENVNAAIISNTNVAAPVPTLTPTPISYAGSYKSFQNGISGRLTIKEIGSTFPKPFNFTFQTATEGCVGEIQGIAKWTKNSVASFRRKNDNYDATNEYERPYCQITFAFAGNKIVVKENQYGCMTYYGVRGCGFDGTYSK